jgi:hypothetical protein
MWRLLFFADGLFAQNKKTKCLFELANICFFIINDNKIYIHVCECMYLFCYLVILLMQQACTFTARRWKGLRPPSNAFCNHGRVSPPSKTACGTEHCRSLWHKAGSVSAWGIPSCTCSRHGPLRGTGACKCGTVKPLQLVKYHPRRWRGNAASYPPHCRTSSVV